MLEAFIYKILKKIKTEEKYEVFSKQLEYSYIMYIYLKKHSSRYIFADEIIESNEIPKSWGRVLLTNMVEKKIIQSAKGKGFKIREMDISFWDFYICIEEKTKTQIEDLKRERKYEKENHYQEILLKIGSKVQEEMMKIKI